MNLFIQIPCYNEAKTLEIALAALPRQMPGFDSVKILIIDDGSRDETSAIAKKWGVDYIVKHSANRGLAAAFMTGLDAALRLGADVIVNTDADNQYNAADIPALVEPILKGEADIVVGARPIAEIDHFSPAKKFLQNLGSKVVRLASGAQIPDAPSGFRAISRKAATRLMVYNPYTYTLETIIQAGQSGMAITSTPVRVNADLRPSRLVKSIPSYIKRSIFTIFHIFTLYRPFSVFSTLGVIILGAGCLIGGRFLYFYLDGQGDGHVQSLILASICIIFGGGSFLLAIIASLLSSNRRLLEDIRAMMRERPLQPPANLWIKKDNKPE